jgi:tRNA A37 threonylcarbamoyltransferase TsaD
VRLLLARPEFCTDNAAMIAAVAGAPGSLVRTGADDLDVQPDLVIG